MVQEGDVVEFDGETYVVERIIERTPEEKHELYLSGRALLPQYKDYAILTAVERSVQEITIGRDTVLVPRQVTVDLPALRKAVIVHSHTRRRR